MTTSDQLLNETISTPTSEQKIVFNGDLHPFHILGPRIRALNSDFAWYIRDSLQNGLIYVDFICNEKVVMDEKGMNNWAYYSIAYGLSKKGWGIVDPNNTSTMSKLVEITPKNVISHLNDLLIKLETVNIEKLYLTPEIPSLINSPIEKSDIIIDEKPFKLGLLFKPELRLYPTQRQVSRIAKYETCTLKNMTSPKKAFLSSTLKNLFKRFFK